MKDSVDRLVLDGFSSLLSSLVQQIGNVSDESGTGATTNVVGMSTIGQPMNNKNTAPNGSSTPIQEEEILVIDCNDAFFVKDEAFKAIHMNRELCNDPDIVEWDLVVYAKLRELIVGSGCLQYVRGLCLKGFRSLERVVVNDDCFTESEGSFEVSDCKRLKSIVIGSGCCLNWSSFVMSNCGASLCFGDGCFSLSGDGSFEVTNCKGISTLKMGSECCANWTSFTLSNCGVSEVIVDEECFVSCRSVVFESERWCVVS